MTVRPWIVVALMAVSLSACSGVEPTLADFARQTSDAAEAYVEESQQLSSSYQRTVEIKVQDIVATGGDSKVEQATELVLTETVAYLAVLTDAMGRYVDEFTSVAVPSSVEEERNGYVSVLTGAYNSLPDLRDDVAASTGIPEIQRVLVSSAFADSQPALESSCLALEQSVRDQGQGIDLKCVRSDLPTGAPSP